MIDQLKKQFNNPDSLVSLFLGVAVVVVTGVLIFNYVKGKKEVTAKPETTKEQQKVNNPAAPLPTTHTIMAGESLWKISEAYFQSGYNWVDIASANKLANADALEAGQKLTIPKVEKRVPVGQVSSSMVEVKKPENSKYTVVQGDTLWSIATKTYGTGYRWGEIAKLNKLSNANLIHAGNVLQLP